MNDSLHIIKQDLNSFTELEIAQTCTQPVFGKGNSKARIILIGEAPGAKEDELGIPFVGRSGKLLDLMLENANLDPKSVYITNIVKFRPPNNRDPNKQEVAACSQFLEREISVIKPKVIATLGRYALNYFFPKLVISQVHGQEITIENQSTIFFPLYHPAVALYNPSKKAELQNDIIKLSKLLS